MLKDPDRKFNNRFAIMIILGDFILPSQRSFWLDELLLKLSWLGVLERTGRSTVARMTKDGWFEVEKVGRRNRYTLTKWGEAVLRQGDLRIFEQSVQDWDGNWHLVIYSLPEEQRVLRHNLVQQLTWLGYGRMARGSWLSPYDRRDALHRALKAPETGQYLHFFSGNYLGNTEIQTLIQTCWDFETVSSEYSRFVRHHQPIIESLEKLESLETGAERLTQERAFSLRFWASYDFLPLLRLDPNLPPQFLPKSWPGAEARRLYMSYKNQFPTQEGFFSA